MLTQQMEWLIARLNKKQRKHNETLVWTQFESYHYIILYQDFCVGFMVEVYSSQSNWPHRNLLKNELKLMTVASTASKPWLRTDMWQKKKTTYNSSFTPIFFVVGDRTRNLALTTNPPYQFFFCLKLMFKIVRPTHLTMN